MKKASQLKKEFKIKETELLSKIKKATMMLIFGQQDLLRKFLIE